ncbi:hypothetical protein G6F52_014207 [Rhizopus delemar]|nr:hypothetical protein G6F52_014207 [Rhizopus delemar]
MVRTALPRRPPGAGRCRTGRHSPARPSPQMPGRPPSGRGHGPSPSRRSLPRCCHTTARCWGDAAGGARCRVLRPPRWHGTPDRSPVACHRRT